ncbi:MAG: hypothetical protein GX038_00555 [Erysipelothrix sp.]|nr:hypothetical protein [Erysipelothrix sp.]
MLKGIPSKKQEYLEQKEYQSRLEADIAQLINENNVLKKRIVNLASELDYTKRVYDEKYHKLKEQENNLSNRISLVNEKTNDIIITAYKNADIIVSEALASAHLALRQMNTLQSVSYDFKKRYENSVKHLEGVLEGIQSDELKNLMIFNKDHDTFFKE